MARKFPVSAQTIALICIFIFLLVRLLIGCDRERQTSQINLAPDDPAPELAVRDRDGNPASLKTPAPGSDRQIVAAMPARASKTE